MMELSATHARSLASRLPAPVRAAMPTPDTSQYYALRFDVQAFEV